MAFAAMTTEQVAEMMEGLFEASARAVPPGLDVTVLIHDARTVLMAHRGDDRETMKALLRAASDLANALPGPAPGPGGES